MPKPPLDKRSAGLPGKKPAARSVWLVFGLAVVLWAAMTRKASGRPVATTNKTKQARAAMLAGQYAMRHDRAA